MERDQKMKFYKYRPLKKSNLYPSLKGSQVIPGIVIESFVNPLDYIWRHTISDVTLTSVGVCRTLSNVTLISVGPFGLRRASQCSTHLQTPLLCIRLVRAVCLASQ